MTTYVVESTLQRSEWRTARTHSYWDKCLQLHHPNTLVLTHCPSFLRTVRLEKLSSKLAVEAACQRPSVSPSGSGVGRRAGRLRPRWTLSTPCTLSSKASAGTLTAHAGFDRTPPGAWLLATRIAAVGLNLQPHTAFGDINKQPDVPSRGTCDT